MPEWGPLGSVRGALSNERPYRDLRNVVANYPFERSLRFLESSRNLATETISAGTQVGLVLLSAFIQLRQGWSLPPGQADRSAFRNASV